MHFEFIPSITGGHVCSDDERKLLSLPTRYRGLALPLFHEISSSEYENSKKLTTSLPQLINDQTKVYHVHEIDQRKIKLDVWSKREHRYKNTLIELCNFMSDSQIRLSSMSQEKGVSYW